MIFKTLSIQNFGFFVVHTNLILNRVPNIAKQVQLFSLEAKTGLEKPPSSKPSCFVFMAKTRLIVE